MKYYKYYETTSDYEADISKIGEDDHYTIYIADTDKSLINSKYVKEPDPYFVFENNGSQITIFKNKTLLNSAKCLNNNQELDVTGSGELTFDCSTVDGDIKIVFEFNIQTASDNTYGMFTGNSSLKEIHGNVFKKLNNSTDFGYCFAGCTLLQSIDGTMFSKCVNAINFDGVFTATNISEIPDNLFFNCINAISFNGSFIDCKKLVKIGNNIFNSDKLTELNQVFTNCELIEYIPENIFFLIPNLRSAGQVFAGCKSLKEIPANLLSKNKELVFFSEVFSDCSSIINIPSSLFSANTKLTNCYAFPLCTSLTEIPEGLFQGNPELISVANCFQNCTSLTEIPNNIFANNLKIEYFDRCFSGCNKISSPTPIGTDSIQLWDRKNNPKYPNSISGTDCFKDCTSIPQYIDGEIPEDWGGISKKQNVDVYLYATKSMSLDSSDLAKGTTIKMGITNTSENIIESGTTITINYTYDGQLSPLLSKTITVQQNVNRIDSISLEIQALKTINGNYYGLKNITLGSDKYNFNIIKGNLLLQLNEFTDAVNTGGLPIAGKWASFTPEFNLTDSTLPIITTGTLCLGLTGLTVNCNLVDSQHIWSCHLSYSSYSSTAIGIRNQIPEEFGTIDKNGYPGINKIESKEIVITPESCPLYNTITVRFNDEKIIS